MRKMFRAEAGKKTSMVRQFPNDHSGKVDRLVGAGARVDAEAFLEQPSKTSLANLYAARGVETLYLKDRTAAEQAKCMHSRGSIYAQGSGWANEP